MAVCYRHSNRETGVSCSNCGNPICPDCMTSTPVGMRCPDCAGKKQRVHTMRSMHVDPIVTTGLVLEDVRTWRTCVVCLEQLGQRMPTGVGVMQSGQIGRPQDEHDTPVSREGWR